MKIQVALDLVDLRRAVELTRELCEAGLEVVEAGTPLIKMFGMPAVSALKTACPRAEVVADLKTADVGSLEARMAREFGADWGTVLGATNIETIEEFVREGRAVGLKSAVDLIGVGDPLSRAREILQKARPDLFVVHLGIDVQRRTGLRFENLLEVAWRLRDEGVGVAIAGGITEREVELVARSGKIIDIIIVGRAVVGDPSPKAKFIMINKILKHTNAVAL
ncbi:MAG: orotidine 5'-phosphate decarboxylase / HUMPS family protein [Pyrobaculum sp.]